MIKADSVTKEVRSGECTSFLCLSDVFLFFIFFFTHLFSHFSLSLSLFSLPQFTCYFVAEVADHCYIRDEEFNWTSRIKKKVKKTIKGKIQKESMKVVELFGQYSTHVSRIYDGASPQLFSALEKGQCRRQHRRIHKDPCARIRQEGEGK